MLFDKHAVKFRIGRKAGNFTGFHNLLILKGLKRRPPIYEQIWPGRNLLGHKLSESSYLGVCKPRMHPLHVTAIGQACLMGLDSIAVSLFGNMIGRKKKYKYKFTD